MYNDIQKVIDDLRADGLQEMIDEQIAQGESFAPEPGILWLIWDDIIVPIGKGIGKALF